MRLASRCFATQGRHKVTEKRYCTSCQVMRPADYGKMIKAGKINRWKCTACFERINIPRYAKKVQEK
jgi:hypothetical protein